MELVSLGHVTDDAAYVPLMLIQMLILHSTHTSLEFTLFDAFFWCPFLMPFFWCPFHHWHDGAVPINHVGPSFPIIQVWNSHSWTLLFTRVKRLLIQKPTNWQGEVFINRTSVESLELWKLGSQTFGYKVTIKCENLFHIYALFPLYNIWEPKIS